MPPKKFTTDDQAFINHWSQRMFYFMKIMRRTNLYAFTIPREVYLAAHKEVAESGLVAGGEPSKRNSDKKVSWEPKPENRVAYVNNAQYLVDRHYAMPPSPRNAAMIMHAGNAGTLCIMNLIITEKPQTIREKFWQEVHKLNNQDLEDTQEERNTQARIYGSRASLPATGKEEDDEDENDNGIDRDPDEDPNYQPFFRNRDQPREPPIRISQGNWHQYERIGETYFIKEENDSTTFTAFELAGFLHLKRGKFYKIRYEGSVDSIRITEKEFFAIVEDGMWF
ncbi:hypothetical protein Clacol_002156 [Clathrus columnatus]|uniref:Uncharacterized protein n=1 Tax=Clathrus columnatus TaxID=1419009 RepID=A0AAV5A004_9AGAM|nr:hypothetical protein Clacol_002156 [Clathrus columnatus]